jgi:G3E family GTPase
MQPVEARRLCPLGLTFTPPTGQYQSEGVLIPVSVITGFLGSGKTTLLRRLLADPRMATAAILVNEFGEVALDHLLLRKVDENIALLNSGCLCCSVRDDLVETLDDMHAKRATGVLPQFDRVVIETTGLADPAPIIHTLLTDESLTQAYWATGMVATVDAVHGNGQLDSHPESVKQAAMADRLVLTKTDLVEPATLERLRGRLKAISPSAMLFEAARDFGPGPDVLFDANPFSTSGKVADVKRWLHAEGAGETTHDHIHDEKRHDDRISTFCLTADSPLDWTRFTEWLALLLTNRGEQVLRVKGLLNIVGCSRPVVIHGVQHVFYPPAELEGWPDGDRRSRIVFITQDLQGDGLAHSFAALAAADSRTAPEQPRD